MMQENAIKFKLPITDDFAISVISPVFCSQNSLLLFYERTSVQLSKITNDWELILVDDCSPDNTWNLACELNRLDCRVKCIRLARNYGQQHATLCGLIHASKPFVITIDDDLQFSPEDIPIFIDKLKNGAQVVFGRINPSCKQHHWFRNIASNINQGLAGKIIGKPKKIALSSFRGMTLDIAKKLGKYQGAHPHITVMLFKLVPHDLILNVDVRHAQRADGKSSTYTLSKLVKILSYLVINHSYLPLRFMVVWGSIISFFSIAYALWAAGRALMGEPPQGWASLAILISFLSGNILLALGILGEYIGRLVEEASDIEQFSVFEKRL
jgi:glycosyltransferase involved in cell wall biosynthesis